jgi:hypothetical protein
MLKQFTDIDMTSAITAGRNLESQVVASHINYLPGLYSPIASHLMSSERLDLVPKFYMYSVRACLLPIRKVQNALLTHYFQHIHPMFPVVDEHHFTELHHKFKNQEEFMDPGDFMIYHAILFAGFGVSIITGIR